MIYYSAYRIASVLLPCLLLTAGCSGVNPAVSADAVLAQSAQAPAPTTKNKTYVVQHAARQTAGLQPVPDLKLTQYKPPPAEPQRFRVPLSPAPLARRIPLVQQPAVRRAVRQVPRKPAITRAAHTKKPLAKKSIVKPTVKPAVKTPAAQRPALLRAHLKTKQNPVAAPTAQRRAKPSANSTQRLPSARQAALLMASRSPAPVAAPSRTNIAQARSATPPTPSEKPPVQLASRSATSAQVHQIATKRRTQRRNLFESVRTTSRTNRSKSSLVDRVINKAKQQIGRKYVWGGESPKEGFDCSGLIQHVMKAAANVTVPRTALRQYRAATKISRKKARRGDLVFFITRGKRVSHVGIYMGNNQFLHAPRTGKRIRIEPIKGYWKKRLVGFGRIPQIWHSTALTQNSHRIRSAESRAER